MVRRAIFTRCCCALHTYTPRTAARRAPSAATNSYLCSATTCRGRAERPTTHYGCDAACVSATARPSENAPAVVTSLQSVPSDATRVHGHPGEHGPFCDLPGARSLPKRAVRNRGPLRRRLRRAWRDASRLETCSGWALHLSASLKTASARRHHCFVRAACGSSSSREISSLHTSQKAATATACCKLANHCACC